MNIADELREYAGNFYLFRYKDVREKLDAIADRIDAEHESICYDYQREHDDWVYIRDTCWVELPKDADGKHVQPSDIPHLTKVRDGKRLAFCPSLELRQDGTWRLAGWTLDRYRIIKPTVEDVLREFALKAAGRGCMTMRSDLVDEYASKLRLREDA